jgi:hypothetical protein
MVVQKVKLVTISAYAEKWKIARSTVYELIEKGTLTRYQDPDKNPLLNINERPSGVKNYKGYRERRIR